MNAKPLLVMAVIFALLFPTAASATQRTVVGPEGQRVTVTQTTKLKDAQVVGVTGTKFNQKVGIYLAFCEVPKRGALPSNCAGGVNLEGESQSSHWISSNAPEYAGDLAKPFTQRGGFILKIRVQRFIGKTDCLVKKCAILTRADHTMPAYRKADVVIPVSFSK